jgi:hypothetical protein
MRAAHILRVLWAAPNSAIGLVFALFFKRRRAIGGILLCEGATWPARLGWHYRAITFGHVVLAVDELDDETLAHERAHVAQFERWGPLFIPAYLCAALVASLKGGRAYWDNHFEVQARRAAGQEPGSRT